MNRWDWAVLVLMMLIGWTLIFGFLRVLLVVIGD